MYFYYLIFLLCSIEMGRTVKSIEFFGINETVPIEDEKYFKCLLEATTAFQEAYNIFTNPGFKTKKDWTKEAESTFASVHSIDIEHGRLFSMRSELPVDVETFFDEYWNRFDDLEEWNDHFLFTKTLKNITEHSQLLHSCTNDIFIIKGREALISRVYRKIGDDYFMAFRSCHDHMPEIPEVRGKVRATVHLAGSKLSPHPSKPNFTIVEQMVCMDVNGFIPNWVMNHITGRMSINDAAKNYEHATKIMAERGPRTVKRSPSPDPDSVD